MNEVHKPVLLKETLDYLNPAPGDNFIDATAGEGGHAMAIAEMIRPEGSLLAIEYDPEYAELLKNNIQEHGLEEIVTVINGSYAEIVELKKETGFPAPRGIMFDFGLSNWQLEKSGRGFSFRKDEILDMRFNPKDNTIPTASEIINSFSREHLIELFSKYGELKHPEKLAKRIIEERKREKISTTGQLVRLIEKSFGSRTQLKAQVFQALRIAVNDELGNIEKGLKSALRLINKKGRIAVISFHSLEDRIVKNLFRDWEKEERGKRINKKVIKPSFEEVAKNPKSRSAKLRIFEVTGN